MVFDAKYRDYNAQGSLKYWKMWKARDKYGKPFNLTALSSSIPMRNSTSGRKPPAEDLIHRRQIGHIYTALRHQPAAGLHRQSAVEKDLCPPLPWRAKGYLHPLCKSTRPWHGITCAPVPTFS